MIPESEWKHDPAVEAIRKQAGWREFHAICAKEKLFFDHVEKRGGRYVGIALIGSGVAHKAAEERGRTPLEAITLAYRACGLRVPAAEPWLDLLNNPATDFDDLMADDFEGLL